MKLASCEANFILPLRYENVNRESEVHFIFGNSGLLSIKLSYVTLRHMSIRAGVVIAIPFQQIDRAPDAEASAERDDQRLEHLDSRIEKLHSKIRGLAAQKRRLPAQPRPPFNVLLKAAVFSWASSKSIAITNDHYMASPPIVQISCLLLFVGTTDRIRVYIF